MLYLALILTADFQDATTDASVARAALRLASFGLPGPDEIRVYDFINFFKHDIAEDYSKGPVSLDARLLRAKLPNDDAGALLQLGFRTARVKREDLRPLNLAVVIDRSGSMGDAGKLDFVKKALDVFISALREEDRLAIIVYDSNAEVLVGSTAVDNPKTLIAAVNAINPGSSTNLHAGLMLGYEEVLKHFDTKRTNKVILLSDGIANAGVVDPEQIVADSKTFNDKNIDLTTIGLGLEYNDVLMNRLAKVGRGDYHFLNDAREIDRIFSQELQGLFERVARAVKVRVTPAPGVSLRAVYGFSFKIEDGAAVFELEDMGRALTMVMPIELAVSKDAAKLADVELTYKDADGKDQKSEAHLAVERLPDGVLESPADASVLKHLTIARLAQSLQDACKLTADGRPSMAADLLSAALARVETLYGPVDKIVDKDLRRVLDLVVQAHKVVAKSDPFNCCEG